jgi:hypothetical protein
VQYGAGLMATKMTVEVVDVCIRAAKVHHLFGKSVQLHGLKTKDMNGKIGIAGGFDPDVDRRSVYLMEDQHENWVKVENITPLEDKRNCERYPLLSEIKDCLGSISLHELCINTNLLNRWEGYHCTRWV